jgi:hypothetical protein
VILSIASIAKEREAFEIDLFEGIEGDMGFRFQRDSSRST